MKHKLKIAVSTLTAAALLISTVFSSVSFADEIESGEIAVAEDEQAFEAEEAEEDVNEAADEETVLLTVDEITTDSAVTNDTEVQAMENFTVALDDVATGGVVPSGFLEGTNNTVYLVPGLAGEDYSLCTSSTYATVTIGDRTVSTYRAGNRPKECNAYTKVPDAGTSIIFRPTETGTFTTYFNSGSFIRVNVFTKETEAPDDDLQLNSPAAADCGYLYAFKAEAGKTYVIATTGATNNCFYGGFKYVKDDSATATASLTGEALETGNEIYITDFDLGTVDATLTETSTSVTLAKGHTYKVSSKSAGQQPLVNGSETFEFDGTDISIELVNVPDVTLEGKFDFQDDGISAADITGLTFTNMVSGAVSEYTAEEANISENGYSVQIKPGEYNVAISTEKAGYTTYDRASVAAEGVSTDDIYVESTSKATGTYMLPEEVNSSATVLTFNGVQYNNGTSVKGGDGSSVIVPVSGVKKVTVSGWYSGTWDINGTGEVTTDSSHGSDSPTITSYITDGTETSVTVNLKGSATTYLYWIKVEDVNASEYKSEINVPGDFDTLTEANAAIEGMTRPDGEAGRVTINILADIQEQVEITAPYVTINGNDHQISWYYGLGTKYYSLGSDGKFSLSLLKDRYSSNEPSAVSYTNTYWGAAFVVSGDNFIAKNTTFKNTYNYEVTEAEIADYAGLSNTSMVERTSTSVDPQTYKAKERSNAFGINADNIQCYNCKILSSQDTFGRNGSTDYGYHVYLKDCVIGGNVDYICGEFTAVFDNCELQWKTYTNDTNDTNGNNAKIGYIVAPKTNPYIFRNCTVTTDLDTEDGLAADVVVSGYYGRTWGANSLTYFVNTETNGLIKEEGWGEMNAGEAETCNFNEYGNTSNGESFTTTGYGNILTDEDDAELIATLTTDAIISEHFNNFVPVGYVSSDGVERGDVTGDGKITAADAAALLKKAKTDSYILPIQNTLLLWSDFADVDSDGYITATDSSKVLRKAREMDYDYL